jgi:hypothetical protein
MDQAYTGLAEVGKIRTQFGMVFVVCLALSLCASGGATINASLKDKHTGTAPATLSNTVCTSNTCTSVATYTVSGQQYTFNGYTTGNPVPQVNTVSYDPSNPGDVEQAKPPLGIGIGLIVGAILLFLCGCIGYWLTMTYKPVAALEGADTVLSVGKTIF